MKKIVIGLIFIMFFSLCQVCFADEILGNIYSTDILAFVNGKPIDGYNIGGWTVVIEIGRAHV